MKIYLGTDHGGFDLKEIIKQFLQGEGYDVEDCGALTFEKTDDYPQYIAKAAKAVSKSLDDKGIIFGGSGQGEAMVANKFDNIRCAVFYGPVIPAHAIDATGKQSHDAFEMLRLTREHNNANMLSLGVRFLTNEEAIKAVTVWLETPFPQEERHQRRINQIREIERDRE